MREILFRAKRTDNGSWVYGDLLTNRKEPEILAYKGQYSVDKSTIDQYTGLTDKNGTKIFEGDIIRSYGSLGDEIIHTITWDDTKALYRLVNIYNSDCGHISQQWIDEFGKEIIGNIHDNPELIEE